MSTIERHMEKTGSDVLGEKPQASAEQLNKSGTKERGVNAMNPGGGSSRSTAPADLNNPSPEPPEASKEKLRENARESAKLDSPQRTNDSTIDPNKPKEDILKGFHGG
jgi:hypothetical protein